ncbi:hypothetical protein SLEP1_g48041 [Rubroshorea leprosula]|uniref:HTH myb-type domain-containing protein n=1 Tax=Rubroshorea leprosula TaxID=152421 RepID=A0AAV5LV70_9ROSI|nr:hypothetical protein SLEP1_g48041 [Rubroshorea leprosula]
MYQHHQHQGKNILPSSRMPIPPERHLFLHGGNGSGDSGLVLSTDAKPRLKWTSDLHDRFIEAVNQLGGADKATPKTIMKLMGIPGLTLYHLKSHLQKYRLSKNLQGQVNIGANKMGTAGMAGDRTSEANGTHMNNLSIGPQTNKSLHIGEALQMQIEVQRKLHEQLEVQRHLQLRIEAQGKYLQAVLEKAQETLGKQNSGSVGLEAAKVQLSELVSKVSTQCLNSAFSDLKELQGYCPQQTQTNPPADCSMDSCLTSCEGSQKDLEIHNNGMRLKITEDPLLPPTELKWCEDRMENKMFLSSIGKGGERSSGDLSMTVGFHGEKGNGNSSSFSEGKYKGREGENAKLSQGNRLPYFSTKLDLNVRGENDAASSCKQFDLNGLSWS